MARTLNAPNITFEQALPRRPACAWQCSPRKTHQVPSRFGTYAILALPEDADAHVKLGKISVALKTYVAIHKVFNEIEDDQYDFHGFSMRKFTVTAYCHLLSWADTLCSHSSFVKAAIAASKIFVSVFDDPSNIAQLSQPAKSSSAEKKAQEKAKKAAQKQAEDAKKAAAKTGVEPEPVAPEDEDVDGLKLLGCSNPLEQAAKILQPFVDLESKNMDLDNGVRCRDTTREEVASGHGFVAGTCTRCRAPGIARTISARRR